jgi:hypothetical protein
LKDLDSLVDEITGKYHRMESFGTVPLDTLRSVMHRMVRSALRMV